MVLFGWLIKSLLPTFSFIGRFTVFGFFSKIRRALSVIRIITTLLVINSKKFISAHKPNGTARTKHELSLARPPLRTHLLRRDWPATFGGINWYNTFKANTCSRLCALVSAHQVQTPYIREGREYIWVSCFLTITSFIFNSVVFFVTMTYINQCVWVVPL
jgi:hypothetical protein